MRDGSLLSQNVPLSTNREGRVALIAAVARALLDGRLPDPEAALFVGAALDAWLRTGGAFERHTRTGAPRGSHHKPHVLYQRLIRDERQVDGDSLQSVGIATDKEEP